MKRKSILLGAVALASIALAPAVADAQVVTILNNLTYGFGIDYGGNSLFDTAISTHQGMEGQDFTVTSAVDLTSAAFIYDDIANGNFAAAKINYSIYKAGTGGAPTTLVESGSVAQAANNGSNASETTTKDGYVGDSTFQPLFETTFAIPFLELTAGNYFFALQDTAYAELALESSYVTTSGGYVSTNDGATWTAGTTGGQDNSIDIALYGAAVPGGVPEPSTWAMMIIGFAALGFAGMQKAKKDTYRLAA